MGIIERVLAAESKILAKLGVATEIRVVEDDETDTKEAADEVEDKNGIKVDAHRMTEKVFPAIAGLMLVSLLKEICDSEPDEGKPGTETESDESREEVNYGKKG